MIDCVMRKKVFNIVNPVSLALRAVAAYIERLTIIRVCEVASHIDMRLQMMTVTTDAIMSSIDN